MLDGRLYKRRKKKRRKKKKSPRGLGGTIGVVVQVTQFLMYLPMRRVCMQSMFMFVIQYMYILLLFRFENRHGWHDDVHLNIAFRFMFYL